MIKKMTSSNLILVVMALLFANVLGVANVTDDVNTLKVAVTCGANQQGEFDNCVNQGLAAAILGEQVNQDPLECSALESLGVLVSTCARVTDGCEVDCDSLNAQGKVENANCVDVGCPLTKGGVVGILLAVALGLALVIWLGASWVNSGKIDKQMRYAD